MTTPTIRTKIYIIIQGMFYDWWEIKEVYLDKDKAIQRIKDLIKLEYKPEEYLPNDDPAYLCWKNQYSEYFKIEERNIQDYTGDLIDSTVSDLVNQPCADSFKINPLVNQGCNSNNVKQDLSNFNLNC